jgi:hypothetical protein
MLPNVGIDTAYLQRGRLSASKRKGFDPKDHPVEPKDIAALASAQLQWAGHEYRYLFSHLLLAMMWTEGQHHLTLDPRTWRFVPIPQDEQIPKPMINLARDFVETIAGKMNRATPRGTVHADTEDPRARIGAEKAASLLRYKDEVDGIANLNRKRARAGIVCGDVFTETLIDKSGAEMVEIPVTIDIPLPDGRVETTILRDEHGNPVTEKVAIADETTDLILPIQIFTNPSGTELKKKRWVHSFAQHDLEFVRQCFPDESDQIESKKMDTTIGAYEGRLLNLILREANATGYGSLYSQQPTHPGDPSTLVQVIRFKPDADYPQGRYFIVAGGVGASGGPLPFGRYMMTHYRYSEVPGSFWSSGLIRDVIGLNRHVEQMMQQAALHRRTMAVPFWLLPERSGGSFAGGDMLTRVGQFITFKHRQGYPPPQAVTPHATMDAGFQSEVELFLEKFLPTVAGTRTMSGDRPQGVYSAAFFKALAATASDRLAPKVEAWLESIEEMNSQRLRAIAQSPAWQIPRRVNFPGRTAGRGMAILSAADFSDNMTYRIETEARTALDDVTKTQVVLDAVRERIADTMQPAVRLAALKALGVPELIGEAAPDIQRAHDENAWIAMGEQVEIGEFEDHAAHYVVHREYEQTAEFDTLKEEHPARAAYHAEHTRRTKQMAEFARSEMMKQAAQMNQSVATDAGPAASGPLPAPTAEAAA